MSRKYSQHILHIVQDMQLTFSRYINLCHGDEPLEEVYGDSLPRLRELKRVWDPENRFNQWFNIL